VPMLYLAVDRIKLTVKKIMEPKTGVSRA
jgi:hypothetical protein